MLWRKPARVALDVRNHNGPSLLPPQPGFTAESTPVCSLSIGLLTFV